MPGFLADFARFLRGSERVGAKSLQIFYDRSTIPQGLTSSRHNGLQSNVLMSPVMWLMRAFTEAQLVVQRRRTDDGGGIIWDRAIDHDAELLIRRPNPSYGADALWKGTVLSYVMDGNAYWRKVRNAFGDVIQLWYIPHWMIRPEYPPDGSQFISHYTLSMGLGHPETLLPRDVVHFRFGLDPENTRLGYSPLKAILREVLTDDEAAQFSKVILTNMGVPGLIVSPQKEAQIKPNDDQVKRLQQYFDTSFSGDRRGAALVLGMPTDVHQFGFDPGKLMLPSLRDISEERVCAALGIPAAVVGFGSGLQSTKVGATMRELVKLAWVQCVRPMQWSFGDQIGDQLLPDFVAPNFRNVFRARFDVSEVSAFQEEAKSEAERVSILVREGILRVDRAQHILGLEVDPTRAIYLKDEPAPPQEQPAAGATPDEDDDDPPNEPEGNGDDADGDADDDTTKLLNGIRNRWLIGATNGNGKH